MKLPLFSSEKKPVNDTPAVDRDLTLLAHVEPFVDLNVAQARVNAMDHAVIARFETMIRQRLNADSPEQLAASLASVLSEIKADVHYLNAALVDARRYRDPNFNFQTPDHESKKHKVDAVEIDLRGHITGGNWYYAEVDGRWAGPESQSSLLFPSLDEGAYRMEFDIVDEIEAGVIDGMAMFVNGLPVMFTRTNPGLPTKLEANFTVDADYKLPFWSLKLQFSKLRSPAALNGSDDRRTLAIRAAAVRFIKVGA
jgi:hypothetical protein